MTPVSSLFLMCFERYLKDNLSSCPKRGKRRHTHKWKFSISTREEMRYCCCLCFIAIFGYMGNKFKVILQDVFYNIHPEHLFFKEGCHKNHMVQNHIHYFKLSINRNYHTLGIYWSNWKIIYQHNIDDKHVTKGTIR